TQTIVPIITSIRLPISLSLPLTDLEVRNGYAYISTDSTTSSDPDIFIIDIRNSDNAELLSSINTGPGISAIALVDNRIYAAAASTAAQLHIIRLDSLRSLILEKKFQLALPFATATPSFASAITYNKKNVFIGTTKWDGPELSIIDVQNPTSPIQKGSLELGTKINDLLIHENTLYTAKSNEQQFGVANITEYSTPYITDSFSSSGWERQEGKSVTYFEDTVDLGRTSGGFNIIADHELFSWYISTSTFDFKYPQSIDVSGGIYGIVRDRKHIFIATRQSGKEFQIFETNMSSTTRKTYSLPIPPQTLTCDGTSLYVLGNSSAVIYKIDFQ
nr:hypothetical protein [bacterium]